MYEIFEKLMQEKGVKAVEVSRATGIAQSTFSDWKRGRCAPKTDKLQKIADYFGVTLAFLTGQEDLPQDAPAYYYDEDARDFARFLHKHPEYKSLFDATRKVKPQDLEVVRQIIERFN